MKEMSDMKYKLIALLLILTPFILLAQEKKKMLSKSSLKEEEDVYTLLNQADKISDKDPKKALDYVEQALSMSLRQKDRRGEAFSYSTLGGINYKQGLYAQSIESYTKALDLFQQQKYEIKVTETRKLLGDAYKANGNFDQAMENYQYALKATDQYKSPDESIELKKNIAGIYERQGKTEEALKIYQEILSIEEKRNNKEGIIAANNSIGNIYLRQDKTQQARQYYEKSNRIALNTEDTSQIAVTFDNIGKTLRKEGKLEDELEIRQQSLEVSKKNNNKQALAENYLNIGKLHIEQKQLDQALTFLEKSADLSKEIGKLDNLASAEEALSEVFRQKNNYLKALEHYKLSVAAKDSLLLQKEKQLASMMNFSDEIVFKQKKIDLLEKDMKLNEQTILLLQEEKNFSRMMIYGLSSGLLIVFGSSWLIYRSSRKRRIANQKLALKSLRSQMNPHFIFNALNSVNNYISKNDERSANKYLSDFSRLMRTVMENSQYEFITLATELSILELYLSLEHSRFREKFDYELTVSEDINPDLVDIPPMLIQPYIENAVWHGLRYREDKGFLKVTVERFGNALRVTVADNGIGRKKSMEIKTANQKNNVSTGLKNTENRLKIINELYRTRMQVQIEDLFPKTQSGTKVTILITPSEKTHS